MENNRIRVADYIAKRFEEYGAKDVFLVTGGGAMHLNDAFARNKALKVTCFHHEQAAAIAAESYYRLINRPVVLNVTTGPGGVNALNGVYGAYVDSIGMIVVSGQVKRETVASLQMLPLRQLGDQEVDIVAMASPIVKYAKLLTDANEIGEIVDKALFVMENGRPGPIWIDVPVDVQSTLVDVHTLSRWDGDLNKLINDPSITPNTKLELETLSNDNELYLDETINKLKSAKRPVLMVGTGIRLSGMHSIFLELADRLKIPVVSGWNAHDVLETDDPYFVGKPGTVGDRSGNFAIQNSDFVLILGCRLNIRQISYNWKCFAEKAWKVMVDVDLAELKKPTLNIDRPIHAALQNYLPKLLKKLETYKNQEIHLSYLTICKNWQSSYPVVLETYKDKKSPVNPYVIFERLFMDMPENVNYIAGNGSACVIGFQTAIIKKGQRLFTNSGCASMGYDVPAAIGMCIAEPGKKVICLAGDGSIMMNIQELQTIKYKNLPIKIIIINNQGYSSIRQTQQAFFSDNVFGTGETDGVGFPDFLSIANAFNLSSVKINSVEGWSGKVVQDLLNNNCPALIEIEVDPEQGFAPKLASRKLEDGTMYSPSLEDMAPFLSRDELIKNIIND